MPHLSAPSWNGNCSCIIRHNSAPVFDIQTTFKVSTRNNAGRWHYPKANKPRLPLRGGVFSCTLLQILDSLRRHIARSPLGPTHDAFFGQINGEAVAHGAGRKAMSGFLRSGRKPNANAPSRATKIGGNIAHRKAVLAYPAKAASHGVMVEDHSVVLTHLFGNVCGKLRVIERDSGIRRVVRGGQLHQLLEKRGILLLPITGSPAPKSTQGWWSGGRKSCRPS